LYDEGRELLLARFIYTGIHVSNLNKSISFYTKALGMKLLFRTRIKETGGKVAWLKSPGSEQVLELNWYPKGYRYGGKSGLDHLAFEVRDAVERYKQLSGNRRGAIPPFPEGKWMLAYVKDPDGNWIELGHRLRQRKRS
jgi:lactoylglutathione lyase